MDIEYVDKPWGLRKIRNLVYGSGVADSESWDGYADKHDSYYCLRRKAYDMGKPELILDCIQLEDCIAEIEDDEVQAALLLKLNGWAEERIGAVLKCRRTGRQLINAGAHSIRNNEAMRCAKI